MRCIIRWLVVSDLFKLILDFATFFRRCGALDVAWLDAEHEGDADKNDKHENVHEGGLLLMRTKEWILINVCGLSAIHRHVQHRVNDGWSCVCAACVV